MLLEKQSPSYVNMVHCEMGKNGILRMLIDYYKVAYWKELVDSFFVVAGSVMYRTKTVDSLSGDKDSLEYLQKELGDMNGSR